MKNNRRMYFNAYQHDFISKFLKGYAPRNHILIAPTGFGKTNVAGTIIQEILSNIQGGKALIIVPRTAIAENYKLFFSDSITEFNIISLNRKTLRIIQATSTKGEWPWRNSTVALTTWDIGKQDDVQAELVDMAWDIVVAEADTVKPQTKRMDFLIALTNENVSKHLLLILNTYGYKLLRNTLSDMPEFSVTQWRTSDIIRAVPNLYDDVLLRVIDYSRSEEEIKFIKQYNRARRMVSQYKLGIYLRPRFISSSIYAAEKEVRKFRNKLIHSDILALFEDVEIINGREENVSIPIKSMETDMYENLLMEVSKTLDLLNDIGVDAKYDALNSLLSTLSDRARIFIYSPYSDTISYLFNSIQETHSNVYHIISTMTSEEVNYILDRFQETGGILIGSTRLITYVHLPLDLVVFFDLPSNKNLVLQVLMKLYISSQPNTGSSQVKYQQEDKWIYVLRDLSNAIPPEASRLRKFQNIEKNHFSTS